MRFRFSSFLKCFAIVGMATLVSCSKDDGKDVPDVVQGAFSFNGQKYNTLQEAVNAAIASEDDETVITLTATTSGDGFTAKDGHVNIDFGSFMYYLNPGKTLSLDNSYVAMTGKGGELVGEGTIIKGSESGLSFEGNLNIEGDMDVKSMDYFGFIEDYSGVYSGSVNLNETSMYVEADKAVLNIETLTPVLSELYVAKAQSVTIDNVVGKDAHVVTSDVAGIVTVKNGAEVHVHNYAAGAPLACDDPTTMYKNCTTCDHHIVYLDEKNTKVAACDPDMLLHFEAVEATKTEWGNIEYWQCEDCGKFYADANGKTLLAPQTIMISPKTDFDPGLFVVDDIFAEQIQAQTRALPAVPVLISVGKKALTFAFDFLSKLDSLMDQSLTPEEQLMDLFMGMDAKLDKILEELKVVNKKLDGITSEIRATQAESELKTRVNKLNDLYRQLDEFGYGEMLFKQMKDTANFKMDDFVTTLKLWNDEKKDRYQVVAELFGTYTSDSGAGLFKSVDVQWRNLLHTKTLWEHEGYGAAQYATLYEAEVLTASVILSAYYITYAKFDTQDPASRKKFIHSELGQLKQRIDKEYQPALQRADSIMRVRNDNYRIYCNFGHADVAFDRNLKEVNVWNTLKSMSETIRFTKTHSDGCNLADLSDAIGCIKEFDDALITSLMGHYKNNNPIDVLTNSIGFNGYTASKPVFISLHEHRHHFDNDCKRTCQNWRGISYSGTDEDIIRFRGILVDGNRDAAFVDEDHALWTWHNIVKNCNIRRSSGYITTWGDQVDGRAVYSTVNKVTLPD